MQTTFGQRLYHLREERLFTQTELAKQLGTNARMLLRWETDKGGS